MRVFAAGGAGHLAVEGYVGVRTSRREILLRFGPIPPALRRPAARSQSRERRDLATQAAMNRCAQEKWCTADKELHAVLEVERRVLRPRWKRIAGAGHASPRPTFVAYGRVGQSFTRVLEPGTPFHMIRHARQEINLDTERLDAPTCSTWLPLRAATGECQSRSYLRTASCSYAWIDISSVKPHVAVFIGAVAGDGAQKHDVLGGGPLTMRGSRGTMYRLLISALLTAATAGCADHPRSLTMPHPQPERPELRLAITETTYHLAPAERVKVRPGFDVDALERLLGRIHPDRRAEILALFQHQPPNSRKELTFLGDPELQAILEEVWAPFWDELPESDLEDETMAIFPGREIAKKRRDSRRRGETE